MDCLNNKLYRLINKEFVIEFVKLVNINCRPIRKQKYSTEYYLYHIILVLTNLQTWKSLQLLHENKCVNHHKTIQDKHLQWSRLNLYEKTYKLIHDKYNLKKLKKSANLTLFIDSANIYNKNGQEQIGYGQNPKNKNREFQ